MTTDVYDRAAIGRRIRAARGAKNLTVQELATKARMSTGYLSEVERGMSAVSVERLGRTASALGLSLSYLLDGEQAQTGDDVHIPNALSEAAEQLGLSYSETRRLLEGRQSLVARRAEAGQQEWDAPQWIEFYNNVKNYLTD